MAKYRKKPVVIEAIQFDGENESEIHAFINGKQYMEHGYNSEDGDYLNIYTLEGVMEARPGDYIIKGVQGEFYPIKEDIFLETYEPVIK